MRNEIKTTVKYYFITVIMAKRESMKKSGKKERRQAEGRQGGRKEGRKKSKRNVDNVLMRTQDVWSHRNWNSLTSLEGMQIATETLGKV